MWNFNILVDIQFYSAMLCGHIDSKTISLNTEFVTIWQWKLRICAWLVLNLNIYRICFLRALLPHWPYQVINNIRTTQPLFSTSLTMHIMYCDALVRMQNFVAIIWAVFAYFYPLLPQTNYIYPLIMATNFSNFAGWSYGHFDIIKIQI